MTYSIYPTRAAAVLAGKSAAEYTGWFILIGFASGAWGFSTIGYPSRLPDIGDMQIGYKRSASGRWYTR